MAVPTCPKCSNTIFRMTDYQPDPSHFKYSFIICSECGAVVGVVDMHHIPSLLQKIAAKLSITNLLR